MTRPFLFCILALAGCGDNLSPETPEDSLDAGPPDATPPPEVDGEYVVKVSPISFVCYEEPRQANTFYTLADIVPQENPQKFDLLSQGLQNTFVYYDRYNMLWDQEIYGHFYDAHVNDVSFGPGITLKAKRFIEGLANGYSLGFYHTFDLGMDLDDGTWDSFCVYEADISGTRRYTPWDRKLRTSIDGQWLVKKTVLESPLNYPSKPTEHPKNHSVIQTTKEFVLMAKKKHSDSMVYVEEDPSTTAQNPLVPQISTVLDRLNLKLNWQPSIETDNRSLPYTHFVTMDTVTQMADDSMFEIDGVYGGSLWYVQRNPTTGTVNATAVEIITGVETTVYETRLWGTLLPNYMNLEFSWKWSVQETGEIKWFQHEHYEGTPRYNPHNHVLVEPPQGAYNAEYTLLKNDCGDTPYTEHRLLDVWLMDDGAVWPKITGFNIEPNVQLGPNGELIMSFTRYNNGEIYTYSFGDNSKITGHAVDLNMTVDVTNNGVHACTAKYKITGPKRYESYR